MRAGCSRRACRREAESPDRTGASADGSPEGQEDPEQPGASPVPSPVPRSSAPRLAPGLEEFLLPLVAPAPASPLPTHPSTGLGCCSHRSRVTACGDGAAGAAGPRSQPAASAPGAPVVCHPVPGAHSTAMLSGQAAPWRSQCGNLVQMG